MNINLVVADDIYTAAFKTIQKVDLKTLGTNYVVVPDRFSLLAEKMVFIALDVESVINVEVIGLNTLATRLLKYCDKEDKVLSELECMLNVRKVLYKSSEKLKVLKRKKYSFNFCENIYKTISLIESSAVKPDDFTYYGKNENLKNKLDDLKLIYDEYLSTLNGNDASLVLEEFLSSMHTCDFFKDTNLYFVGFDSFTHLGYQILVNLSASANSVYVAATKPKVQANDFIYETDLMEKINSLCKLFGISVNTEEVINEDDEVHSILKRELFSGANSYKVSVPSCFIFKCKDELLEIKNLAKEIKYKVYKGKRFKDFNVGLNNINKYSEQVERIFTEYGIPYYIDSDMTLSETLLARFYISFLEMLNNFEYSKICSYKNSIYLPCDKKLLDKLDEIMPKNIYEVKKYNVLKEKLEKEINLYEDIKNKKTCKEIIETTKFVLDFEDESILENIAFSHAKEFDIYKEARKKIYDVLNQVEDFEQEVDLKDFIDIIKFSFSSCKLSSVPTMIDSVFVGDITTSFFEDRDELFVIGADSASLPVYLKDCGLLTDADIESTSAVFKLEPTIQMFNRRNRFKLFNNLLRFKQKLNIFYNIASGELASFGEDILKIFIDENGNKFKTLEPDKIIYLKDSSLKTEMLIKQLASYNEAGNLLCESFLPAIFKGSLKNAGNYEYIKKEPLQNIDYGEELFFKQGKTKVTQLEKYFACPFSHFLSFGLKIKEKPAISLQKNEYGSIMHAVAEKFIKSYDDNNVDKFAKKCLEEALDEFSKTEFLSEIDKCFLIFEAISICKRIAYEQKYSKFKPSMLEKYFSEEDSIKIKVKDKEINLVGVVDRVDEFNEYFRIIDYKTGKTSSLLKELYYGNKLQLFVYANAIEKQLNKKCAGIFYFNANLSYKNQVETILKGEYLSDKEIILAMDSRFSVENKKSDIISASVSSKSKDEHLIFTDSSGISSEEFITLKNYANEIISIAATELFEGNIECNPFYEECSYCKYKSICRFNGVGRRNADKITVESFKEKKDG